MNKIFCLFVLIANFTFGEMIGRGIGETEILAKKSALEELSQQVEVKVDSLFFMEENYDGIEYIKNSSGETNLSSNNFLLGVEYKIEKVGKNYSALAIISNDKLYLYEEKIKESYELADSYFEKSSLTKSPAEKKNYLQGSLKEIKKGNSFKNIALLLGKPKIATLNVNESDIEKALQELKNSNMDKIILYIKIDKGFENVKNIIAKSIAQISKDNNLDILMGDEDYNNTVLLVKISSLTQEDIPAFYYNNKKINERMFKSNVSLTFVLKEKLGDSVYDTFTLSANGKSFLNLDDSLSNAINRALKEDREKIGIMLENLY